jgi:very-short-patch-repair endonuclease
MGKNFYKPQITNSNSNHAHGQHSMSDAEKKLWGELQGKQIGNKFRKHAVYGPYTFDFLSLSAKLAIEITKNYPLTEEKQKKRANRAAFLQKEGFTILNISEAEILTNMDGVLQRIWMRITPQVDEPA